MCNYLIQKLGQFLRGAFPDEINLKRGANERSDGLRLPAFIVSPLRGHTGTKSRIPNALLSPR